MSLNYCASQIAEQRSVIEHGARSRELVASYAGDWADSQRRRARTIIQLMRLNRQTEHLKNSMMSGGQIGSIPLTVHGAPVRVGGAQTPVNHWAFEFLKAAAKSGLIDAEEVVNANLAGGLTMVGPQ